MTLFGKFVVLLLTIGLPRIPFSNVPILVLVLPFLGRELFPYLRSKFVSVFVLVLITYVVWGGGMSLIGGSMRDLTFHLSLAVRFMLTLFSALIFYGALERNRLSVLLWIMAQASLVVGSTVSPALFSALVYFSGESSRFVTQELYGLRGIGFGLVHVNGSFILGGASLLILSIGNVSLRDRFICLLGLCCSILAARSGFLLLAAGLVTELWALVTIGLVGLVSVPYIVTNATPAWGVWYEAFEFLINGFRYGNWSTRSTDANLEMFVMPDTILHWVSGYGRYFEPTVLGELEFFRLTDLGWIRQLLFGGLIFCLIYAVLNLMWLGNFWSGDNRLKRTIVAMVFAGLFVAINFKGIQDIIFLGVIFNFSARRPLSVDAGEAGAAEVR